MCSRHKKEEARYPITESTIDMIRTPKAKALASVAIQWNVADQSSFQAIFSASIPWVFPEFSKELPNVIEYPYIRPQVAGLLISQVVATAITILARDGTARIAATTVWATGTIGPRSKPIATARGTERRLSRHRSGRKRCPAKGKKIHDKRETIKARDWKREAGRLLKERG